jgi:two-component system, NarL family, sensor histidine kinase DesK
MSLSNPRVVLAGRVFMVLFVLPLFAGALPDAIDPAHPVGQRLAVALSVLLVSALWTWFWLRPIGHHDGGWALATLVGYVLFLAIIAAGLAPAGSGLLVAACILAGALLPWRRGMLAVLAVCILDIGVSVLHHLSAPAAINIFFNDLLVGVVAVGVRQGIVAYRELEAARSEIGRLAVSEERLRFARDLHDLLGQSLATVVLKSEVLARQLQPDADPALRREALEVAGIARRSLQDVRAAVAGYRQASLRTEFASGRAMLAAAGISAEIDAASGELPEQVDSVLAWAVREGVTNVVRHSRAKDCEIRLSRSDHEVTLEMTDDGVGASLMRAGNGLRGIGERVALVGGEVRHAGDNGHGFRLVVVIPLAAKERQQQLPVGP